MFHLAGTAEIVRSNQKDDFYQSFFRSSIADVVQSIAGPLRWMRWRRELDVLSDVGYFLLTTFGGFQTVGEEYVNIIMVDGSKRSLPSKLSRGMMIGLQVVTPYLVHWALDKLEHRLQSGDSLPVDITGPQRDQLLWMIPVLRHSLTLVYRAHLSLFYIQGIFYHLSKRFSGIHYIRLMAKQDDSGLSKPFRLLGYLSLAQVLVSTAFQLYTAYKSRASSPESLLDFVGGTTVEDSTTIDPTLKCSLCLGQRKRSTLTVCGHMFCWDCIHQWFQEKTECPLCREQFPLNRLVALQNYDPV